MKIDKRRAALITAALVGLGVAALLYLVYFTPASFTMEATGPNGERVTVTARLVNPQVHLQEADTWLPVRAVNSLPFAAYRTGGGQIIDQVDLGMITYTATWSGWTVNNLAWLQIQFASWLQANRHDSIPWYPQTQTAAWDSTMTQTWTAGLVFVPSESGSLNSFVTIPAITIADQLAPYWQPVDGDEFRLTIAGRAVGADAEPATATITVPSHRGGQLCNADGDPTPGNYAYMANYFTFFATGETVTFEWTAKMFAKAKIADLLGSTNPDRASTVYWTLLLGMTAAAILLTIYGLKKKPKIPVIDRWIS